MKAFWSNVNKTSGCWIWLGSTTNDGHGQLKVNGRTAPAHRVAYELLVGPIPNGLEIDHLCRNPPCVNPAHMEPVTHRVNVQRGLLGDLCEPKTTCNHGHDLTDERNVYIVRSRRAAPYRTCRVCRNDLSREYSRAQRYQQRKKLEDAR